MLIIDLKMKILIFCDWHYLSTKIILGEFYTRENGGIEMTTLA